MKDINKARLIQIDITNACIKKCAHCTRAIRHITKPHMYDLLFIEKALQSLKGRKGVVGCMGGEPTIHPQFVEICNLFRKYLPKNKRALFTCGGEKYKEHEKLIHQTFGHISYNAHYKTYHQPLMVGSGEVIIDKDLREELIEKCWIQDKRSPSITPRGAFFCEVAATLDYLSNGPGGYPIEQGWWNKTVEEFRDQRDRYCKMCSIPIPMDSLPDTIDYELVSPKNAEMLRGTPLDIQGKLRIIDKIFTREDIDKMQKNKKPSERHTPKKSGYYWIKEPLLFKINNLFKLLLSRKFKSKFLWRLREIFKINK